MRSVLLVLLLLGAVAGVSADSGPPRYFGSIFDQRPEQKLIPAKEAFFGAYWLIHRGDARALYYYMYSNQPEGGWAYALNSYRAPSGLNALERALADKHHINSYIINLLLGYGANPNLPLPRDLDRSIFNQGKFYKGWTAAHIAVRVKASQHIRNLLEHYRCDFEAQDDLGWRPQDVARADGRKRANNKRSRRLR